MHVETLNRKAFLLDTRGDIIRRQLSLSLMAFINAETLSLHLNQPYLQV